MRLRVDPSKVKVITMRDGTRYRVSRNGIVSISPAHEAELKNSPILHDVAETGAIGPGIGHIETRGNECGACEFNAWPWTKVCPRCGHPL
jgi:hypothetical protein